MRRKSLSVLALLLIAALVVTALRAGSHCANSARGQQ
jgi:hypothetical protein